MAADAGISAMANARRTHMSAQKNVWIRLKSFLPFRGFLRIGIDAS